MTTELEKLIKNATKHIGQLQVEELNADQIEMMLRDLATESYLKGQAKAASEPRGDHEPISRFIAEQECSTEPGRGAHDGETPNLIRLRWSKDRPCVEGLYLQKGDFVTAVNAYMRNGHLHVGQMRASDYHGWQWCGPLEILEPAAPEPKPDLAMVNTKGEIYGSATAWYEAWKADTDRLKAENERLTKERDEARKNAIYWKDCNKANANAVREMERQNLGLREVLHQVGEATTDYYRGN